MDLSKYPVPIIRPKFCPLWKIFEQQNDLVHVKNRQVQDSVQSSKNESHKEISCYDSILKLSSWKKLSGLKMSSHLLDPLYWFRYYFIWTIIWTLSQMGQALR